MLWSPAIFEITQDISRVDQTHHFNMFLLDIHRFKFWKRSKKQDNIVFWWPKSLI